MDFGSKYVYKYDHSSEESLSEDDDEMLEPFAVALPHAAATALAVPASSGSAAAPAPPEASVAVASASASKAKRKKRLRKADTNVLSVKFNRLLQPGEMHAGDPVPCAECGALASHLSKIQQDTSEENRGDAPSSKWQCDFCSHINTVDIEQSDLPRKEDATYLLEPAPIVHGSDMTGVDDSMVIFLIDTSGSMSSTTLVQGRFELPNAARERERASANFDGERIRRDRHQTYVSRLQGVQMAVDANLDKLATEASTRRAALLTFNHEITYYGDGTRDEPLVIRGDKLNNADDLLREAEREQNHELKPISETKTRLKERVYDLEEGGQTALGPAVFLALNIAAKRRGSKLVICTDGLANRGLGNLELAQDEKAAPEAKMQALDEGNQFYAGLTERAREQGVSISVITIKGTTCLLSVIGQMADGTGGNVTIVDLLNIRDEFSSILEQKVTATNVEATLIVHRGLYIRDPDHPDDKLEKIKREIGNVTKQTEVTFEFGVRNKQELKEKYQIDLDQLKQLPFQVQVTYVASDGSKALRVLTQLKEATENRVVAEINAHRGVLAENHLRSTATEIMMFDDDEDDDEDAESYGKKNRTKWSSPVVQKQRMAYMSKLSDHKRAHRQEHTDRFSESFWSKASSDIKTRVDQTKRQKMAAKVTMTPPTSAAAPSFFNRLTQMFSSSSGEAAASASVEPKAERSVASKPTAPASKKTYGFSSSNVRYQTDTASEDLYRYKNISSDLLETKTPYRDEASSTGSFHPAVSTVLEKDDEETDESKKNKSETTTGKKDQTEE